MSVTFDEARRVVYEDMRRTWKRSQGTLVTLPGGYEDDTHWQVVAGAKQWLVDRDSAFQLMDAPAILVNKRTGNITRLTVLDNFKRLNEMTPVGA